MKKFIYLTAITLSSAGFGQSKSESSQELDSVSLENLQNIEIPRVIGGTIPEAGSLDSIAVLIAQGAISIDGAEAKTQLLGLCTSTLISPTALLTAAHCVDQTLLKTAIESSKGPNGETAKLEGSVGFQVAFVSDLAQIQQDPSVMRPVTKVDAHQNFALNGRPWVVLKGNPNQWDDIALVHLNDAVLDHKIQKLATPAQMVELADDSSLERRFAGYGISDEKDQTTAGTLREGYSTLGKRSDYEFIAGVDGVQHACHGDSGGPIFLGDTDDYQIGIASRVNKRVGLGDIWGGITGGAKAPSCTLGLVYTRVDPYLSWIKERVSDIVFE